VPFFAKPPAGLQETEGLSAREQEILNLPVKGHAYKTIPDQFSIIVNTVRTFIPAAKPRRKL